MRLHSVGLVWLILGVTFGSDAGPFGSDVGPQVLGQESLPKVRAVGLSLAVVDPDNEFGNSYVMGRQAGIEVVLMANDPQAFFVAVVDQGKEKTVLDLIADGKKLKDERGFSSIGFMSNISENGQRVTVPVTATQLPPKGTRSLKVSGTLVLRAGSEVKTDKSNFKVAEGESVKLGPVAARISGVEEYDFEGPMTTISFESNQSLEAISGLKFFLRDGKELESTSGGSSSYGFGDEMTYGRAFQIPGRPTELTVEVTYFGSTKTLAIPVDIDVDLSLGGQ
jgi:hypothetical protein